MTIKDVFASCYHGDIQLTSFQAQTIGSAILSRSPGCKLLVFGLGNDTKLWLTLNEAGRTEFLDASREWITKMSAVHPHLSVSVMPTFRLTVQSSMRLEPADFARFPLPAVYAQSRWDVIVVDAPPGHKRSAPGRAVAIYWASRLATDDTHVFVHDYERALETHFANQFLRDGRSNPTTVIAASHDSPKRSLFWSIGNPLGG